MHTHIAAAILTLIAFTRAQDLSNLGRDIQESVQRSLEPLNGLGARINSAVRQGLTPLDNLGSRIQQQVYEGLEPVRALEIKNKMKNGIGGVTIVQYQPGGAEFIIRNNRRSKCSGTIDRASGQCSGTETPFQIQGDEDYCFMNGGYSIINGNICVGASFVSIINNEIKCKNDDGRPVLFTTVDKFRDICRNVAATANYRYITDKSNPQHVEIPNTNRYVKCTNNDDITCDFQESNHFITGLGGRQSIFIQSLYKTN